MKLAIWVIGQYHSPYIKTGVEEYLSRLQKYLPTEWEHIVSSKAKKTLNPDQQKVIEAEAVLKKIKPGDKFICLDEYGKTISSVELSQLMQKCMIEVPGRLILLIGGAYGLSDILLKQSLMNLSLSKLTFTHQFAWLITVEQLYRAMTILANEPYHHE
ncbi:MAG: 23S rRNA (pseudouridine(1915)-N(3))-methyltransferase RlmH [Bacteroidota bacterium]|nr:23S rRNA (pseudouridine(1915)-N(3))-methyltransferase RlmH [Bacteroidota bacterium]